MGRVYGECMAAVVRQSKTAEEENSAMTTVLKLSRNAPERRSNTFLNAATPLTAINNQDQQRV